MSILRVWRVRSRSFITTPRRAVACRTREPSEQCRTRGLRLVSFSRPGYGDSTRFEGRRVADIAVDVRWLLEDLEIERAVTWGHSGGRPHALATAALNPDVVWLADGKGATACGLGVSSRYRTEVSCGYRDLTVASAETECAQHANAVHEGHSCPPPSGRPACCTGRSGARSLRRTRMTSLLAMTSPPWRHPIA